jgi:hypothetical protein
LKYTGRSAQRTLQNPRVPTQLRNSNPDSRFQKAEDRGMLIDLVDSLGSVIRHQLSGILNLESGL